MTRSYARSPRAASERGHAPGPLATSDLAGGTTRGLEAPMTIPEPTDGDIFLAYLEQVLCPRLRPGQVVIMDNLSAHKVAGVRELIEATGARLIYPPPYSPDLNPIEQVWSKVKQILRSLKGAPPMRSKPPSLRLSPRLLPRTQSPGLPIVDMVYNKYENALATSGCRGLVPTTNQSPVDATAWLKLVETRFGLSNLTHRDKSQMDMTVSSSTNSTHSACAVRKWALLSEPSAVGISAARGRAQDKR